MKIKKRWSNGVPCRCNKRSCQARVTRRRFPWEYKLNRYKRCKFANCDGMLYVDWHRYYGRPGDRAPGCNCDGYLHPHRVDQPHCKGYVEYTTARAAKPTPTHYPFPPEERAPF